MNKMKTKYSSVNNHRCIFFPNQLFSGSNVPSYESNPWAPFVCPVFISGKISSFHQKQDGTLQNPSISYLHRAHI